MPTFKIGDALKTVTLKEGHRLEVGFGLLSEGIGEEWNALVVNTGTEDLLIELPKGTGIYFRQLPMAEAE